MPPALGDFLEAHALELLQPGFGRLFLVLVASYGAVVTLLVVVWQLDGLRGGAGRAITTLLALSGLGGSAALGVAYALPVWTERAVSLAAQNVDSLGVAASLGAAVLAPAVRAYTRDGEDDDALFALEGAGARATGSRGLDLAVLATPEGRQRALVGLTVARLRAEYDRALSTSSRPIPEWAADRIDAVVNAELAALVDAYPTLLSALTPGEDGALPVPLAESQVARVLLAEVLPAHLRQRTSEALAGPVRTLIFSWLGVLAGAVLIRVLWGVWQVRARAASSR